MYLRSSAAIHKAVHTHAHLVLPTASDAEFVVDLAFYFTFVSWGIPCTTEVPQQFNSIEPHNK